MSIFDNVSLLDDLITTNMDGAVMNYNGKGVIVTAYLIDNSLHLELYENDEDDIPIKSIKFELKEI